MIDDFAQIDLDELRKLTSNIEEHYLADELEQLFKRACVRYAKASYKYVNIDSLYENGVDPTERGALFIAIYNALKYKKDKLNKLTKVELKDLCNDISDKLLESARFIEQIGANYILLPLTLEICCDKDLEGLLHHSFKDGLVFEHNEELTNEIRNALRIYTRKVRAKNQLRITELLTAYSEFIKKIPSKYTKIVLKPGSKNAELTFFCRKMKQFFMCQYNTPNHEITSILANMFFGDEHKNYDANEIRHITRGFFDDSEECFYGDVFLEKRLKN